MAKDFNYERNKRGMDDFIRSQMLGSAMFDIAQEGAQYARSIAPVRSGAYRGSISAEQVTVPVTKANEPRAGAQISTNSAYGASIESQYKIMSRTADHLNRKGG